MFEPSQLKPAAATAKESNSSSSLTAQKVSNRSTITAIVILILATSVLCVMSLMIVSALFITMSDHQDAIRIRELISKALFNDESADSDNLFNTSSETLFEETFNTNTNGWETGLIEGEFGQEEVTIQDGVYTLSVAGEEAFYAEQLLPSHTFSDFILTVEMTPPDRAEHYSYGVTFRQNEDLESYVIEIGNDGLYSVAAFTDDWVMLQDWTFSKAIKIGETNELSIRAEGSLMTFWVNGEILTSIEDDALDNGSIGLVLETFEDDQPEAAVNFDNLVINSLDSH